MSRGCLVAAQLVPQPGEYGDVLATRHRDRLLGSRDLGQYRHMQAPLDVTGVAQPMVETIYQQRQPESEQEPTQKSGAEVESGDGVVGAGGNGALVMIWPAVTAEEFSTESRLLRLVIWLIRMLRCASA